MATWNKFNQYVFNKLCGKHDFRAAGNVIKVMLTNTAPIAANAVKADITEIAAGHGYTAGGEDAQNDLTLTANVAGVSAVDIVWTAAGGTIGPFRYAVVYDDTQTTPVKPLIGWYDYGSAITLADAETFTIDFGLTMLTDQ